MAFLVLFGTAVLFLTLGLTTGPRLLFYVSLALFGFLAAGLLLRGTLNAADWGTAFLVGRPPKDDR
jgi:hypothetical protein